MTIERERLKKPKSVNYSKSQTHAAFFRCWEVQRDDLFGSFIIFLIAYFCYFRFIIIVASKEF